MLILVLSSYQQTESYVPMILAASHRDFSFTVLLLWGFLFVCLLVVFLLLFCFICLTSLLNFFVSFAFIFCVFCFYDMFLLYSIGCPGTNYMDQADLQCTESNLALPCLRYFHAYVIFRSQPANPPELWWVSLPNSPVSMGFPHDTCASV